MGQIIVRVLVGLVSAVTAFSMNVGALQQIASPIRASKSSVVKPIIQQRPQHRPIQKRLIQQRPFGVVRQSSLSSNEYGAHWGDSNGTPSFIDGFGSAFVNNAKGVIDVSEHQKVIDWNAVKASGVDGAIIRISYGWGNGYDKQALRNISECKRLGIPFGIYMYSYAEKPADGAAEGADIVNLLRGAGVSPEDLTYPVYYDLERWTWSGHKPPTSPYVYQDIVASWWNQLVSAGYTKLGVYSYANYLKGPLNSVYIHDRTSWVASYGSRVGFPIVTALRGWQYTSDGSVNGIEGRVDLSAFGMYNGGAINAVSEFANSNGVDNAPHMDFTWIIRDNDIAVGSSVSNASGHRLEYRWLSYNLSTKQWETISDWSAGNWASWVTSNGDYWLHCEARDAYTNSVVAKKTIAFRYGIKNPKNISTYQDDNNPSDQNSNGDSDFVGKTVVASTYAGWRGGSVLLGAVTNNPHGYTVIKIYDYKAKQWVSQFKGPWALWNPKPGIYWTHFEAYSADGKLQDSKTYCFGV